MTSNIQTAKKHLTMSMANAKIAKAIIGHNVEQARILMDEATLHDMQTLALEASSAVATIESNLAMFARVGFNSKKFAVTKK